MTILNSFNIDNTKHKFFKNNLEWNNIPQFSVIAGVNGSGKTKLLDMINQNFITEKREKECFYIPIHEHFSLSSFDRGAKEQEEMSLIGILKSWRNIWKEEYDRKQYYKKENYYNIVEWLEEKYSKPISKYSDSEINEVVKKIPLEKFQENIKNLKFQNYFIRFFEKQTEIKSEVLHEIFNSGAKQISTEQTKEAIRNKTIEIFGTDIAPWTIINEEFKKHGLNYKISEPKNPRNFNIKFINNHEEEIDFHQLSSGEQVIIQLILWSYDSNDKRKNGNRNKLLLMDEFDARLNPKMAEMFIAITKEVLVEKFKMQVIMTTHSPSTVAYCEEGDLFWMNNGKISKKLKQEIIEELTPGIITLRHDALLLLTDKKNIIITEGDTDIDYITTASRKLGFQEIIDNCEFIAAHGDKGKDYFNIFKNSKSPRKTLIIFDFDKTGIEAYNSLAKTKSQIRKENLGPPKETQYFTESNISALLLPRNQVDYPLEDRHGYHPIELLFKKDDLTKYQKDAIIVQTDPRATSQSYFIEPIRGPDAIKLNLDKKSFANYIKEKEDEIDFSNFQPLLESIKEIFSI